MAQFSLRVNLSASAFPFVSEFSGRSIIVPQFDQNFDRTTLNAPGVIIDKGIPQAYYMHNCMPTVQGYQSIGYKQILPAYGPGATDFDVAFLLQTINKVNFIFVPSTGKNYIFDSGISAWISVSPVAPGTYPIGIQVTTAFVQGESYIYYAKVGCFKYDDVGHTLVPVVLTGLNPALVLGIASANGYMIAWTTNNVAWSSLTTPTDFTPSLSTGAGGGAVNDAKGSIIVCLPLSGGFIIYCTQNAVGSRFSGNINFPFIFKEIPGSAGINHSRDVSFHANLSFHVVISQNGLQKLSLIASEQIYAEATDFLAGEIFEDFDEITKLLTTSYLIAPLAVNITIIDARFLVISYGVVVDKFTHALVFDILLNRWGKLRVDHKDCFQNAFPTVFNSATDDFRHSFCFLQETGVVKSINFSFSEADANGVIILGKYQLQRTQRIEHQICEVDCVRGDLSNFQYFILPTQDGKTLQKAVPGFLVTNSPRTKIYKKLINAYNLSALFMGGFHLTSLNFTFTQGGYLK